MDKDTIVCRCEEVTAEELQAAIQKGAASLEELKRRTRCGMGLCQGKTCSRLAARMLAEAQNLSPADIPAPRKRPPVGAIRLDELATGED